MRITQLHFPEQNTFSEYSFKSQRDLSGLSKVNIFIGSNNSGKSRFLRSLVNATQLDFSVERPEPKEFKTLLEKYNNEFCRVTQLTKRQASDHTQLGPLIEAEKLNNLYSGINPQYLVVLKQLENNKKFYESSIQVLPNERRPLKSDLMALFDLTKQFQAELGAMCSIEDTYPRNRCYIPILRGLRPIGEHEKDHYCERTKLDYFGEIAEQPDFPILFTGLGLYDDLKSKLLGEPEERETVREYEKFLSRKFFDSQIVTLIPRDKKDTVYIKIGNSPQLAIYDVGDGLQSVIVSTYLPFCTKTPTIFGIEEPDICMHPGMQRTLIDSLLETKNHLFFITTHSNHLMEMIFESDDISAYHFQKKDTATPSFMISQVAQRDDKVLKSLGVRSASVFHANSTIWVEGITDRVYMKLFLHRYFQDLYAEKVDQRNFREDIHYAFVEYQGSCLTHWNFGEDEQDGKIKALAVCSKAIIVADADIKSKGDRYETLKHIVGERIVTTPGKEVENCIPEELLRAAAAKKYAKYGGDVEKIKFSEYCREDCCLGEYLDSKLPLPSGQKVFASDSGCVRDKMGLCLDVLHHSKNLTWKLPDSVKKICERILQHIVTENGE